MEYIHIDLKNVGRQIHFPFRVWGIGYQLGGTLKEYDFCYQDKIEYCIRLSNRDENVVNYVDGQKYILRGPHLFVKQPFKQIRNIITDQRNAFFIYYGRDSLPALRLAGMVPENPFRKIMEIQNIQKLILELKAKFQTVELKGEADRIDQLAFRLISECFLMAEEHYSDKKIELDQKVRKAASHMRYYFQEKQDIEALARSLGMSKCSFYRKWKQVFSITPQEYLSSLRLAEACRLLTETDLPVSTVAGKIALEDPVYFIKFFKSKFGMTPLKYRQKHRFPVSLKTPEE